MNTATIIPTVGDYASLYLYFRQQAERNRNTAHEITIDGIGYFQVMARADAYDHAANMLRIVADIQDYTLDTPDADLSETEAESRPIFIHAMEQAPQDDYMVMMCQALDLKPAKK